MFDPFKNNSSKGSTPFIIGRVIKIILGEFLKDGQRNSDYKSEKDLGAIYFESLYSNTGGQSGNMSYSKPAYPLNSSMRHYPTIGEILLIIPGPSSNLNDGASSQDLYYFSPFSLWGSPNHNIFPSLREYSKFLSKQNITGSSYPEMPQGFTFTPNNIVKTLRPFEGDIIIQGRFGQSIRLGSTVSEFKSGNNWSSGESANGSPITIISNSQKKYTLVEADSPVTVEDINRDGSSIYLTENQSIIMSDIDLFPRRSYTMGQAINPQIQELTVIERHPITNEFTSANDQDNNNAS